ncbi:MAG: MBL fold metallo-hydrolase [Pseudomonadota bacterium]
MRIHHLNCGTMCPHGGKLIGTPGGWLSPGRMVCHCLLVESNDGLVLVDTGMGTGDLADPAGSLGRPFVALTRPVLDPAETALAQVRALGFSPDDVRHIVVTHLDLDHAGGIPDFPKAQVHVHAKEHAAAMKPSLREKARYRPAHFRHQPQWALHSESGERWFGFDAVRALPGAGDDVLMIPLHGHTRGHCGVAVRSGEGWLLHGGDAYFHHGELQDPPYCPPGLTLFQNIVQMDRTTRLANQERLRALAQAKAGTVRIFSAHDPVELERLAAG